jgi:hypothetical protein
MSQDCRNDCMQPSIFPKVPNNRPGLPHIEYRIGTYSDFREALLLNLNKNGFLSSWTHRGPDDPGIALLEGASILGDILSFYQELYANEAYLRTAQWRESISDLVRLLGYRLSPGLGGKAAFAFEVKGDKPVIIPKGFPIKAEVKGLEQPVDFETNKETIAIPYLSRFHLHRPTDIPQFSTEVHIFSIETSELEQAGLELNEKDILMLLDTDSVAISNTQIVVVKKVEQQFDRTNIIIEGTWKKGSSQNRIKAYKLGRIFRHFGHNAPPEVVKLDVVPSQKAITYNRNLYSQTSSINGTTIAPSFTAKEIPLDVEVEDLVIGSNIIIRGLTIVRRVESFRTSSMTWGALSGATTIITIDEELDANGLTADIRNLVIHETIGKALTLKNTRQIIDSSADGTRLYCYVDSVSYKQLNNRRLAFVKKDGTSMETLVNTEDKDLSDEEGKELRPIFLNPPLTANFSLDDFPLDKPQVTVYGNLVYATQGKTEKEAVLGNGDSRQTFQTFKLPKAPLTYHISSEETPPEVPELQIYISDRLWNRVPSFFGRGPKDEIYIVREDEKGDSWVQFGDGKTGTKLPSGIKTVVAKYRTGTGAYGALKEGTNAQSGGKLDRLDKIQLPGVVSGGSEPETGDNAREAAPGKIQSLGRLVSLRDFESETLAISGVSKASAAWALVDNTSAVIVAVLMETGRDVEIDEVRHKLNSYNKCRGPQRFPIIVHQGKLQYIYVDAVFGLNPSFREELVKAAIKEALGITGEEGNGIDGSKGLFGLFKRRFGESEYATRIEGSIQNVEGVVWAKVKTLISLGEAEDSSELSYPFISKTNLLSKIQIKEGKKFPPIKTLSKFTRSFTSRVISCDNLHILSLYKDHLQLSVSGAESKEVC